MFVQKIITPLIDSIKNHSEKNAFCINEIFYTYADFSQQISNIRFGIQSKTFISKNIGLVVNDDIQTYAAIFAIWLEGYAYVPLHPLQPLDRNKEIIDQAQIDLIIDSSNQTRYVSCDVLNSVLINDSLVDLLPKDVSNDSLAYILFTSGSTGQPKGVQITRDNIGSFMHSFWQCGIDISSTDKCLQCFDLTFDVSVQSYLVPLTRGACVYTIPHNQIKYSYVYGLLEDHGLTFGAMAPSMIRLLRPYFDEISAPLMRYNILTAEASPIDLVEEWMNCIPNCKVIDFYGPTEATIYCTYYTLQGKGHSKHLNGMVSIGKPMPGLKAVIIDDQCQTLGVNQKGELCIAGPQVTPGYWKNAEKNAEVLIEITVDGVTETYYKTGDLCYFDEDGDIMYSGRIDFQVKIQGYRIELGEIDHHVRSFMEGHNAISIAFENNMGNTEIALFVESLDYTKGQIIEHLKTKIPSYMIPTQYYFEQQFPLNTSGKIDRKVLKAKMQC